MSAKMPACPICGEPLSVKLARGRRSGKAFVMLMCVLDGRHFRGFISHRPYVQEILDKLEAVIKRNEGGNV